MPLLVDGLDPHLAERSSECKAFPADPAEATSLVIANLEYFDAHNVSWTISSFTAPHLISDYRYFIGTKLDDGWTCAKAEGEPQGLGIVLLSHLWDARPHGLFTVSSTRGGFVIARGAVADAYGPILADRDLSAVSRPLPYVLGNVSVRITDSSGSVR